MLLLLLYIIIYNNKKVNHGDDINDTDYRSTSSGLTFLVGNNFFIQFSRRPSINLTPVIGRACRWKRIHPLLRTNHHHHHRRRRHRHRRRHHHHHHRYLHHHQRHYYDHDHHHKKIIIIIVVIIIGLIKVVVTWRFVFP